MRETITIIGFVQSVFGIMLFLTKRPMHLSLKVLIAWFSIIAIILGSMLLPFEVVDYFKPGIFPILFLFGPLLLFYVASLAISKFKLKPLHLLHILPLFLVCLHRSLTDAVSITSSSDLTENPSYFYNKIYHVLLIISLFVYWIASIRLILNHRKNIKRAHP